LPNYPAIPDRLLEIDELIISEHWHVDPDDDCYFMWERISGASYQESATNQLIANLQIPMSQREANPWRFRYKGHAVRYSAHALGALLPGDWRVNGTFVPIPPSRVKDDPEHDPRVLAVLQTVNPALADIRELVLLRENAEAKAKNVSPHERAENYEIDEGETDPEPEHLIIFDDVLAGASHFKAMKMVLSERFPDATVTGLFLARSIRPNQDLMIPTLNDDE
jgi:hypothetical protein